jgi:F-type H+-transporting ATPase subunit c
MDVSTILTLVQQTIAQNVPVEAAQGISGEDFKIAVGCVSAAFVMGLGTFGPGLAEGYAAAKACEGIARNPEAAGQITRAMIIGQAVTESVAIYALVVAALILFVAI